MKHIIKGPCMYVWTWHRGISIGPESCVLCVCILYDITTEYYEPCHDKHDKTKCKATAECALIYICRCEEKHKYADFGLWSIIINPCKYCILIN